MAGVEACPNLQSSDAPVTDDTTILPLRQPGSIIEPLTEIARDGARRRLMAALKAEILRLCRDVFRRPARQSQRRLIRPRHPKSDIAQYPKSSSSPARLRNSVKIVQRITSMTPGATTLLPDQVPQRVLKENSFCERRVLQ